MTDLFTDIRKTIVVSTGIHLVLVLMFLFMRAGFEYEAPDFAEVSFVSNTQVQDNTAPPAQGETQVQDEAQPEPAEEDPVAEEPEVEPPSSEELAEVPVNLPQRRMLFEEETLPQSTQSEMPTSDAGEGELLERSNQDAGRETAAIRSERSAGERLAASPQQFSGSDMSASPTTQMEGGTNAQPFTIEGQAAERAILSQVIPEYPEGLQKEATIRIRFTVLPDGRVGQMIPVQKDSPELEEITLRALRQWRFNPLSSDAEQQVVQGVITFRYELL